MQNLAWINGETCELSSAKVSLEDRGYLFGDGIYEVTKIKNGIPFYLEAHLERFSRSAAAIEINIPYSNEEITKITAQLIKQSGCLEGYVYMQLTRGIAPRDHMFPAGASPVLAMYVRELRQSDRGVGKGPLICITLPDERWLNCYIKTLNLLPNVLARQKAARQGAIEAILYRQDTGLVTEATRSNVFAVLDGIVRTHPESNLILSGISRAVVLKILRELDIACSEEAFTRSDLERASEVWITNTGLDVIQVDKLDGNPVGTGGPGHYFQQVRARFTEIIAEYCGS